MAFIFWHPVFSKFRILILNRSILKAWRNSVTSSIRVVDLYHHSFVAIASKLSEMWRGSETEQSQKEKNKTKQTNKQTKTKPTLNRINFNIFETGFGLFSLVSLEKRYFHLKNLKSLDKCYFRTNRVLCLGHGNTRCKWDTVSAVSSLSFVWHMTWCNTGCVRSRPKRYKCLIIERPKRSDLYGRNTVFDRISALLRLSASLKHEIWNKRLSSNKRPSSINYKRLLRPAKNSKNLCLGTEVILQYRKTHLWICV